MWQRKLSRTLTISRVDEDIPTEKQKPSRKPWSVALTRKPGAVPKVKYLPAGDTLLLSEDEVVALVQYLVEPQSVLWTENPSPTEAGKCAARVFLEQGMIGTSKSGEIVNGEAHWTPKYFKRQKPVNELRSPKVHTLPWKLPKK